MNLKKIEDRPTPKEVYNVRIYMYALVAAWGAAIFGYDSAFIGGTIALASFKDQFNLKSGTSHYNAISANIVSFYQVGCFAGALLSYPIAQRFGRKPTLVLSGLVFCIGAAVMFASKHTLGAFYAGRVIGGLGVGSVSLCVPLYIAEISPPSIRGRLGGFYELLLQVGGVIGFWINYGVTEHISPSSKQWHIPIGVQLIPGGLLLLGSFFILPETPRWTRSRALIELRKGNTEQSDILLARSLALTASIRGLPEDHTYVKEEIAMIDEQLHATVQFSGYGAQLRELGKPGMCNCFGSAFLMMMFQNLTGINAINYYSPRIFQSIGIVGTSAQLFGTGIYGIVKLIVTFVWALFLIDNIGRRKLIVFGSVGAIFSLFYVGSYIQISTKGKSVVDVTPGPITSGGISAAAFIYLFAICFSASWNGTSWVYISEIFPTHVRTLGVSLSAANQWLWQFVVARSTPYMLTNIKAGTYFFFGSCTIFGMIWAIFFMRETKGVNLEAMDALFGYDPAKQSGTAARGVNLEAATTSSEGDIEKGSLEERRRERA